MKTPEVPYSAVVIYRLSIAAVINPMLNDSKSANASHDACTVLLDVGVVLFVGIRLQGHVSE